MNRDEKCPGIDLDTVSWFEPLQTAFIYPMIPLGYVSCIEGDRDDGLGLVIDDVLARYSNLVGLDGRRLDWGYSGRALVISDRVNPADLNRQLLRAGADTERIFVASSRDISLPFDLELLGESVVRNDFNMVLIDPAFGYSDCGLGAMDAEARRQSIVGLANIAYQEAVAIVLVAHSPGDGFHGYRRDPRPL